MSRGLQLAAIAALAFAYVFYCTDRRQQKAHYALVQALADGVPYIDASARDPDLATIARRASKGTSTRRRRGARAFQPCPSSSS
jgi:hypothetical protein